MKFQEKTLEVRHNSVFIFGVMLSLIFIIASSSHFFNTEKNINRIENSAMSFIGYATSTKIAIILSRIVMLIGGVSLFFWL